MYRGDLDPCYCNHVKRRPRQVKCKDSVKKLQVGKAKKGSSEQSPGLCAPEAFSRCKVNTN